jgi:hypothetical protein
MKTATRLGGRGIVAAANYRRLVTRPADSVHGYSARARPAKAGRVGRLSFISWSPSRFAPFSLNFSPQWLEVLAELKFRDVVEGASLRSPGSQNGASMPQRNTPEFITTVSVLVLLGIALIVRIRERRRGAG